jgi:hypothetical protein
MGPSSYMRRWPKRRYAAHTCKLNKFTITRSLQQRIKYILRICPESTEHAKRLKSEHVQFPRTLRMNNVTATKLYMCA